MFPYSFCFTCFLKFLKKYLTLSLAVLVIACGGGGGGGTSDPVAPTITSQPSDETVVAGNTASFTVVASNATAYQWQISIDAGITWTNISGANSASYTTENTTVSMSNSRYRVVIAGAGNTSVTSSTVTLTVSPNVVAPTITAQPVNTTVVAGQNASFSVTATGTSLTYQWRISTNGGTSYTNLSGQTNPTLQLNTVPITSNGYLYRVVVSNSADTAVSAPASLTVNPAPVKPVFTTQPVNKAVNAPSPASFTVAVTGTPAPSVIWQISTNNGISWSAITGATNLSYTTPATSATDNAKQYRALATNSAGSTNSNAATLTVSSTPTAPSYTQQPISAMVVTPNTASFTALAAGNPTPTLQWQFSSNGGNSWSNINGATNSTYTTPPTSITDDGKKYRVIASNASASLVSNMVTLGTMGSWQPATLVESSTESASQPQIAINANGNATAIWKQYNVVAGMFYLYGSRYNGSSGTWSAAKLINNSLSTQSPKLAVDVSGNAMAVWYQNNTTNGTDIYASRYSVSSNVWGSPVLLETITGFMVDPEVGMDASGNAIVVWQKSNGGDIYTNRYSVTSGTWGTATVLNPASSDDAFSPKIAVDTSGNALVVWYRPTSAGSNVYATRYNTSTSSWGTPILLNATGSNAESPTVAVDPAGNAMALWKQYGGGVYNIYASRYNVSSGTWSTAVLLENKGGNADDPQVALDSSGNAIAVWSHQLSGSLYDIYAARYNVSSTTWGSPTLLKSQVGASFFPQVALDSVGNSVVVWYQTNGSGSDIYAARYRARPGDWDAPVLLETSSNNATSPQIAIAPNGTAMAIWEQSNGSAYDIYSARFK